MSCQAKIARNTFTKQIAIQRKINMNYFTSILLMIIFTQTINAQKMNKIDYEIEGMTMAVTNMEQMLAFYSNTFNIQFAEKEMYGSKLYSGVWGGLKLLFCPAEIAGNTAVQNRHQFDIVVSDLEKVIELTKKYGGKLMGEIAEDEHYRNIGIYDPDKNSILFKQKKK